MLVAIFFNDLRNENKRGNHMAFFGVQEAVSSNLAVPTFKINNLRAPKRCPFCFGDIFGDIFDSISRSFLIAPKISRETAARYLLPAAGE
jgi:hypothetical protein